MDDFRVIFKMRVELFCSAIFKMQGGLLNGLKNQAFLGVIFRVKNRLFLGLKMQQKSAQKSRPKMRKNAQNGQNSA